MSRTKPIGWITAGTLICVAGVSIACRLKDGTQPPPPSASTAVPAPPEASWSEPAPYQPVEAREVASPPAPVPSVEPPRFEAPDVTAGTPAPPVPAPPGGDSELSSPPVPSTVTNVPSVGETTTPPPPTELPRPRVTDSSELIEPPSIRRASGESPPAPVEISTGREIEITAPTPEPPKVEPRRPRVVEEVIPAKAEVPATPPVRDLSPPVSAPPAYNPPTPAPSIPPLTPPVERVPEPRSMTYKVRVKGLSLQSIARQMLGNQNRWPEIDRLNPGLRGNLLVPVGTVLTLPADAQMEARLKVDFQFGEEEKAEVAGANRRAKMVRGKLPVSHLPLVRAKTVVEKERRTAMLLGTYSCTIDKSGNVVLPSEVLKQMKSTDQVLLTPGPDRCLWIMSEECAKCVLKRVEKTAVRDDVVRAFKRLYYAQTAKVDIDVEGSTNVPDKMIDYAGLSGELILVGVEDHFELWDAQRWQAYSMEKSVEEKPYGKKRSPFPTEDE